MEQQGRAFIVHNQGVHATVIVKVGRGQSAPQDGAVKRLSRGAADVLEALTLAVAQEQRTLAKRGGGSDPVNVVVYVAVCEQEVRIPVVVGIQKLYAESQQLPGHFRKSGRDTHLV